jgi:hypothetical protein
MAHFLYKARIEFDISSQKAQKRSEIDFGVGRSGTATCHTEEVVNHTPSLVLNHAHIVFS